MTKQEHFHRYREETSGNHRGEGSGERRDGPMELRDTNYYV